MIILGKEAQEYARHDGTEYEIVKGIFKIRVKKHSKQIEAAVGYGASWQLLYRGMDSTIIDAGRNVTVEDAVIQAEEVAKKIAIEMEQVACFIR
jgi:hypothetical protein